MEIYISGIGIVCGLGAGIGKLEKALNGEIAPSLSRAEILVPGGRKEVSYYKASLDEIERFVSPRTLRRVDTFSQAALLASYLAIEDGKASLDKIERMGIVFGSAHGPVSTTFDFIDTLIDNGDGGASPTHFTNSVHNAPAAQVSLFLKIKGPCSTLSNFRSTFASVLFEATRWLEEERADFVLAGAGEDFCPAEGYIVDACSGGAALSKIEPLSLDTCSYIPGQGWVTFLLSRTGNTGGYGKIAGLGLNEPIDRIDQNKIDKASALIIGARGDKAENKNYKLLMKERPGRYSAYSHLYGSLATGSAFDLAAAALSIKNKTVYASGSKTSQESMTAAGHVICIESTERSLFNVYELEE